MGTEYIGRGWHRYEAFAEILRNHPPRKEKREGDLVVLSVTFTPYGNIYNYLSKDDVYRPGDLVEVLVSGERKVVTVEDVGYYSEEEYPFKDVILNTVIGPAEGELKDKYLEVIEKELEDQAEDEAIRTEAKKILEEVRALKLDALEEKKKADEEKKKAEHEREQAEHDRREAERILKEAEEKREEIKKLADETMRVGKKARRENERLEKAKAEAKKVWKRRRPKTSNEVILGLRGVQDALDEDEEIYRGLSALEEKIVNVMARADEIKGDKGKANLKEEIDMLYTFYFPKTIDVLEQYRNIFSSGLPPKSVDSLRTEVLNTIARSEEVYDNIMDDLYRQDIIELSAELKALQSMFAINGLIDEWPR